ncbi:MAG: lipopolysaccharide biosynthesis protein [Verrucomicrobiota bacterium]
MKSLGQIFRSSALYAFGMFFEQICGMVTGLFVARLLGPHTQGIWQTARLFRTYSDLSTLGQGFGMRREVAVALGAGDQKEVEDQRDTGFVWNTGCMLVAAAVVLGVALAASPPALLRRALFGIAAALVLTGVSTFFSFWYKTIERFGALALIAVVGGLASLLTVALVYGLGFDGLIAGYVLATAAVLGAQVVAFRDRIRLRFSTAAWRRSFALGFPLWLTMISGLVFSSVDRILVISLMGFSDMGFYSVSTMCFMPVETAVGSLAVVLLPRACRRYGEDLSAAGLGRYFLTPLGILMVGLPAVAVAIALAVPFVVRVLLPAYEAGIQPAQIALFGLAFSAASGFCHNVVLAAGRTWWLVAATLLSSLAKLALVWLLIARGLGLSGVAGAGVLAYVVQFVLLVALAAHVTRCALGEWGRVVLEALASAAACAWVWRYVSAAASSSFAGHGAGLAGAAGVVLLLLWIALRRVVRLLQTQ